MIFVVFQKGKEKRIGRSKRRRWRRNIRGEFFSHHAAQMGRTGGGKFYCVVEKRRPALQPVSISPRDRKINNITGGRAKLKP